MTATLFAQIFELLVIIGLIFGIYSIIRFFKDLKIKMTTIDEKLNTILERISTNK